MKNFPILGELFSSDSAIFGLALAAFIGVKMKDIKKNRIAIAASLIIYAVCEVVSNIHTTIFIELLLLFAGTISIGCFVGFFDCFGNMQSKKIELK